MAHHTLGASGIAAGPPLSALSGLVAGPRIDSLLDRAAGLHPDRCALRTQTEMITYSAFNELASRCAVAIGKLTGGPGSRVAIAARLDPAFAIAYYGVARSGNVAVIVNPYLKSAGLAHLLRASQATVAILTSELGDQLQQLPGSLPDLRHVVLYGQQGLLEDCAADRERDAAAAGDDIASILFTSGTTGTAKGVPLTHDQLIVNAAQTAHAQELGDDAIMFNYLPTFHTMHLNAAVCAAIPQILGSGDDVAASVRQAEHYQATHYYTLPVRLNRLAADPRLAELSLRSARAILSGGSALPAGTAVALSGHFGVPVVQGYGLAEAAPLTHFNDRGDPMPGSCGTPVAGTECRIVEVDTRRVLDAGESGEVQIRGPQVMAGYLDDDACDEPDAQGWLSTGDIGRMSAAGHLYLIDRIKDVFKCDNYLISPSELEHLLSEHPAVADCAVHDYPHDLSGSVAHGLVVLRDGAGADLAEIMRSVNSRVPDYMALRALRVTDAVPRSPNGKIQRRELREATRQG